MISIKLDPALVKKTITDIACRVDEAIDRELDEHFSSAGTLLECEELFYLTISLDVESFLELAPTALENEFRELLAANPDYVVYASGSLDDVRHHILLADLPRFESSWAIHNKKQSKKGCGCDFCKVSSRARKVFNWSAFSQKDKSAKFQDSMAGTLVKSIGLVVCPYCSRNYIAPITEPADTIYRPDLDHFYAKSIYPYFALCVHNLVPSCSACNCRIKGSKDFMFEGFLHPYEDEAPDQLFVLDGLPLVKGERLDPALLTLRINDCISDKARKSAEFFRLPLAYEMHKREVCNYVESLRLIPEKLIEERARVLRTDPGYLKLIMNRSDDPHDKTYKERALGKLFRDMYRFCTTKFSVDDQGI